MYFKASRDKVSKLICWVCHPHPNINKNKKLCHLVSFFSCWYLHESQEKPTYRGSFVSSHIRAKDPLRVLLFIMDGWMVRRMVGVVLYILHHFSEFRMKWPAGWLVVWIADWLTDCQPVCLDGGCSLNNADDLTIFIIPICYLWTWLRLWLLAVVVPTGVFLCVFQLKVKTNINP